MVDPVLFHIHRQTLVITLNRPEARNALTYQMSQMVQEEMTGLDDNPRLRAAVITGAGGVFSAGADLKAFLRGERPATADHGLLGFGDTPPGKPVIAAVEGWALAAGCEVALACDLVVAARGAKFGLPEAKRGLAAVGGGLVRLPQRIPYHLAMEIALTGEPFSAEWGHRYGLVNRLTEDGQALENALVLADQVAANAPLSVAAATGIIRQSRHWRPAEVSAEVARFIDPILHSQDAREGALAFAEKRPARWVGR